MKKITILVDELSSHGGIEKLVAIKANYWSETFGYKVTIISTDQNKKPSIYSLSDKVNTIDFAINYNRQISFFSFSNLFKLVKNIFLIQKYFFQKRPDFIIVASHIPLTYIIPFLFSSGKKIKEFHYSKFTMDLMKTSNRIQGFIESKYDFNVILSQEEKNFYPLDNAIVISNPILKTPNFGTIPFDIKKNRAIFVGRIAPVKQVDVLIEIWKKFIVVKPDWELHIYGAIDSQYALDIQKNIIQNKLENKILLKGQSNSVDYEISKSKVLLLTSSQECFPMVILESQALGIPVISFDSPTGPRNIITNDFNGILVEHNNNDKFVDELVRFEEDKILQKHLSFNGLETSKAYDLDVIMKKWNDLIFTK